MRLPRLVGRCYVILLIALLLDVAGLVLLLLGIFGQLGAWDFFIYTGAIILCLSLVFWVFWYTFNIEISSKAFDLGY